MTSHTILSATMKHFAFRTCALRVRRDFWQAFRTSHLGPGQIYFFPFAFRTPKQPKLELLISHFAPIRSAPITLHPHCWARQNCIAGLNLFSESKNCGIQNVYGTNRVMCQSETIKYVCRRKCDIHNFVVHVYNIIYMYMGTNPMHLIMLQIVCLKCY